MLKIIQRLFLLMLFTLVIPNGMILGIDVKIICVLLLVVLIAISNFRVMIRDEKFLVISFIYFSGLLCWSIIGSNNGFNFINQLKSFIQIYLIIFINYQIFKNKMIEHRKLLYAIYFIAFIKVIVKVLIEVLLFSSVLSFTQVQQIYYFLFSTEPVFGHIGQGGLIRIQTYVDIFPLIVYGFFMLDEFKNNWIKFIFTVFIPPYVIIVYSRMFMLQYAIICLTLSIYFIRKYNIKLYIKRVNKFIIFGLLIAVLGFLYYQFSFGFLHEIIGHRFNSSEVIASDNIRHFQSDYLLDEYSDSPIIGKGMGAYISQYTTTDIESNKFAYEKEYLAFLMQFGTVGFVILIIGTISLCLFCLNEIVEWKKTERIIIIIGLINFILYLIKPIFNPFFYTIYIDMTLLMCFGYIYSQKNIGFNSVNLKN